MVIQYAFYGTKTIFADFDLLYCYYAHFYEQFSNNSAKKKTFYLNWFYEIHKNHNE